MRGRSIARRAGQAARRLAAVAAVAATILTPPRAQAGTSRQATGQGARILRNLAALSNPNWARVAGRDTGLPPKVNGHDEFARAWTRRMLAALHGLPATVIHEPFPAGGFRGYPAVTPGVNVAVVVPGAVHPQQAMVIGAHYDGIIWSHGSAYDDSSGCAITIEVARLLAAQWRQHGLPAETVEFVLFDAEEEGITGSIAWVGALHQGAIGPQPRFMIDEEQSGVGYPVRPFGLATEGTLPSEALLTRPHPRDRMPVWLARLLAERLGGFTAPSPAALKLAHKRVLAARAAAFRLLHAADPVILYRGGARAAFSPSDGMELAVQRDPGVGSDNEPFEALGLPTVTLAGDTTFYNRQAPDWAFPYDQPEDTLRNLACDTGGSPRPGLALGAALALEAQFSALLVERYAPATHGTGIAVFSAVPVAGVPLQLTAAGPGTIHWDFGDGDGGTGGTVAHTYRRPGTYHLRLRAGPANIGETITVAAAAPPPWQPQPGFIPPRKQWAPPELQGIKGCK